MSGSTFHDGTIESVVRNYGEISLQENRPYSKAIFDIKSVGNATDDLTKHFKKGVKVRAKIKRVHKENGDDEINAYCVMLADNDDSTLRGGDIYLKKFLESHGPQGLNSLLEILMKITDNCPRFLKSGKIEDFKNVVLSRPDWFEICDDMLCLIPLEEVAEGTLLTILGNSNPVSIEDIDSKLSEFKKVNGYLNAQNMMDYVSRHPDSLVFWKDSIWRCELMLSDNQDGKIFQNDMIAVKYYSQFASSDTLVTVNTLRGHYSQADDIVKQAVKPKDAEFRSFLRRNKFFYVLDSEDNILSCLKHRLHVIDKYWSVKSNAQDQTGILSSTSQEVNNTAPMKNQGEVNFTNAPSLNNKEIEDIVQQYLQSSGYIELAKYSQVSECPEVIPHGMQRIDAEELQKLVKRCPSIFSIRNGFFCLNVLENMAIEKIFSFLDLSGLSSVDLKSQVEKIPEIANYLIGDGSQDSIYEFVSRNSHWFIFWKKCIYLCKHIFADSEKKESFNAEMQAVKFYSKFIKKDSAPTPIVSVRGHYAQASPEIRSVAHSRPQDFVEFLKRNEFFFDVVDESVKMTDYHVRHLNSIETWLDPDFQKKSISRIPNKSSLKKQRTIKETHSSHTDIKPRITETINSFSDEIENTGFPIQESRAFVDDSKSTITNLTQTVEAPACGTNMHEVTNKVFDEHSISNDRRNAQHFDDVFRRLLADELLNVLETELLNENDIHDLILLRLQLGKPLKARFWDQNGQCGRKITLETRSVEFSDLNRVLHADAVVKTADGHHYGIKGTLHSFNVMEQHGEPCEVTIFFQVHTQCDGLQLDIFKGACFEAIFTGNYPDKWIYNFMRCRSGTLSQTKDVLVLDLYGKMSGCDDAAHSSLGDVSRITCGVSDLAETILKVIPQKREIIFIVGIDSSEQIEAMKKMCGTGIKVIAEVSQSLKSQVKLLP